MKLSRMRQGIPALFLLLLLFILMPPAPACAAGQPPGTDLEKLISDAAAGRSKLNFMSLYRQLWQTGGMEKKLDLAVDAAFDEQTEELSLSGVSLVLNSDNFVEHIEEAVMAKFSADYDTFLRSLETAGMPCCWQTLRRSADSTLTSPQKVRPNLPGACGCGRGRLQMRGIICLSRPLPARKTELPA